MQVRYKAAGKVKNCEYPRLPDTLETRHAKEAAELHSQVQNAAAAPGYFEQGSADAVIVFLYH